LFSPILEKSNSLAQNYAFDRLKISDFDPLLGTGYLIDDCSLTNPQQTFVKLTTRLRNWLRGNKRGASDGQKRAVGTPRSR
jgi:hypothetical protein